MNLTYRIFNLSVFFTNEFVNLSGKEIKYKVLLKLKGIFKYSISIQNLLKKKVQYIIMHNLSKRYHNMSYIIVHFDLH